MNQDHFQWFYTKAFVCIYNKLLLRWLTATSEVLHDLNCFAQSMSECGFLCRCGYGQLFQPNTVYHIRHSASALVPDRVWKWGLVCVNTFINRTETPFHSAVKHTSNPPHRIISHIIRITLRCSLVWSHIHAPSYISTESHILDLVRPVEQGASAPVCIGTINKIRFVLFLMRQPRNELASEYPELWFPQNYVV